MTFLLLSTLAALVIISSTKAGSQLGEYITEFSPLYYDSVELHTRHLISKRSLYEKSIDLQLEHGERKLDLSLYKSDDEIFHPDTIISTDGVDSKLDTSHLYSGHVKGDPHSSVSGSIINGVFQGIIKTGDDNVYYVERKEYHSSHPLTKHENIHSVIYKQSDVDLDKFYQKRRAKRSSSGSGAYCGRSIQNVANWMSGLEGHATAKTARTKRATTPANNVCNMFLQSDPEMWKYFENLFPADRTMVRQEITSLIRELVKEVNGIYRNTDFAGQTGYELRVDRLAVNETCKPNKERHWFCEEDLDVSNFLNLNTYTNHDPYCLAYILTNRDFADGTLGLAWVAQPGTQVGGICSKYRLYQENGSSRYKSLNTGIVTIKNYGERVPQLMSQLTLAHEIGHNFGSEHDPSGCTPYTENGDEDGNYIMYYAAISGKRSNNIKFSSCSTQSIGAVLANSRSTSCFKTPTSGHCGNQILDGSEECDCGYDNPDCTDCCPCCNAQNEANNADNACKLLSNALCDPSQGPCCNSTCGYHPASVECRPDTECSQKSFCDKSSPQCPASVAEPDGKLCDSKTKVCSAGECSESVCTKIGPIWRECSLSIDAGGDASNLCTISCLNTTHYQCLSSADPNLPQAFKDMLSNISATGGISVKPGYPCDKDRGFCDYFLTCRKINELGPFARLKGLLLELTSVESLTAWLKKYWWAVLLAVLGLVLFTFLLVKFGAYFTPSSNPEKPAARKLTKPMTQPERRRAVDGTTEPLRAGPTAGNRRSDEMEMR